MKAVIVAAGGQVNEGVLSYLTGADIIIAADGGGEPLIRLGIIPEAIIGDFDSLSPETTAKLERLGSKLVRVESEKDETDTELAVRYALQLGADTITLLGVLGGRLDHSLANLILLARLARKQVRARAATAFLTVYAVTDELVVRGREGELVSVFPFQGSAAGVTEIGFKYLLRDAHLDPFAVVGISNVLAGPKGVIRVKKGVLLVFHYHDQKPG
jgi:thiamine pyrophosphokinase